MGENSSNNVSSRPPTTEKPSHVSPLTDNRRTYDKSMHVSGSGNTAAVVNVSSAFPQVVARSEGAERLSGYVETRDPLIAQKLQENKSLLIHGITGSGKTTLAKAFLFNFRQKNSDNYTYLLQAENMTVFHNSLLSLTKAIIGDDKYDESIQKYNDFDKKIDYAAGQIMLFLQTKPSCSCAFVLDNLDQDAESIVSRFNQIVNNGHSNIILLTSQHDYIAGFFYGTLDLDKEKLNIEAAMQILSQFFQNRDRDMSMLGSYGEWLGLIEYLGSLPLALTVAGRYLYEENRVCFRLNMPSNMSIVHVKQYQDDMKNTVLDLESASEKERAIYAQEVAVLTSLNKALLESGNQDKLGGFLCFLNSLFGNHLPTNLLDRYIEVINNASIKTDTRPYYKALMDYSLLGCGSEGYIRVHYCVKDVIRKYLRPKLQLNFVDMFRCQASAVITQWNKTEQNNTPNSLPELKMHADSLLKEIDDHPQMAQDLVVENLKVLLAQHMFLTHWDADQIFKYLGNWISGEPSLSNHDKTSAYITLADAFLYVDAKPGEKIIMEKIFTLNETLNQNLDLFIENDSSKGMRLRLLAQIILGTAYDMQHHWQKAKKIYDDILSQKDNIRKRFQTDMDDLLLMAEERLGRVYYYSCRFDLAEEIFNRTLALKKSLPNGESSRDTVHTLFELGVTCKRKGDYERSRILLEEAYHKILPKYLVADLGIAHVQYELGQIYFYHARYSSKEIQGQYVNKSFECYTESLRHLRELDHKYATMLAGLYSTSEINDNSNRDRESSLSDSHFHTLAQFMAWNYHGLAELGFLEMPEQSADIEVSERFVKIDNYLQKTLSIQERVYTVYNDGENVGDMDTAITLTSLAQLWMEREPDRAKAYLEQSLAIQSRDYSDENPHTHFAKTLHVMGKYILLHQNDLTESEQCFNRALEMYRRIHGEHSRHPNIIEVENALEGQAERRRIFLN